MFGTGEMVALLAIMLAMVFAGVHVAVALGIGAVAGIYMMQGDMIVVRNFIANTAYEALRDYVFAVIPLFMLMGDFLAKCGAARDLFALINRLTRWVRPAGDRDGVRERSVRVRDRRLDRRRRSVLADRLPGDEALRLRPKFALGCHRGSACLGMLIPPRC
jgi:hypothetical protein